jgi:hypothetical protein
MGGWKQKEESSLLVPSTFLFLYQPSVCLCVSRVRAYLTTNQQVSYCLRRSCVILDCRLQPYIGPISVFDLLH